LQVQKALELLKSKLTINKILILVFGSFYNKQTSDAIPFETRFLGRLRDDYSINLVYNATDIFIAPSLAETFGYVILESLACGTPVVGFDVGGIPDLIKHKENGYLAKYKDSDDLTTGIKYCLENSTKGEILPVFEPENVIRKHLNLIEHLISVE
jgi:glycosyltransferase involved in cell wall biosynthesis